MVLTARKIEHGDDVDPELLLASGAGGFAGGFAGVVKGARTHILEHLRVLQQSRQRRRDHVRGRHRVPAGRSLTHLRAGRLCETDWAREGAHELWANNISRNGVPPSFFNATDRFFSW